jgi:hypothetical protein
MRAITAYTASVGLLIFFADAFRLDLPVPALLLITAGVTAFFAVMFASFISGIITLGLTAVGIVIVSFTYSDIIAFMENAMFTLWNTVMTRLADAGYQSLGVLTLNELEGVAPELYTIVAVTATSVLFSLLFTSCILHRVKLFPILFFGIIVCSSIFTYNISGDNLGFALIMASLCAIAVLKFYDTIYNNGKLDKKSAGLGGYAGFAALILALITVVIPMSRVNKRWVEIPSINDNLNYARAFISSIVIGNTPNLSDLGYLGNMDTLNTRSARAEDRSFDGKVMMKVETAFNLPIYLRSWIGSYYVGDSWYSATTDTVNGYKDEFGANFSPEVLTYNFYKYINPRFVTLNNLSSYVNHIDDGFVTTSVDVSGVKSTGNLLYVPSVMNAEPGALKSGTRDYEQYGGEWNNYYEGIVTTSWFNFNKSYRAVTFAPIYRSDKFNDNLNNHLRYYHLSIAFIKQYGSDGAFGDRRQAIVEEFAQLAESYGLEYAEPSILDRYFDMNNIERQNFWLEQIYMPERYSAFVAKNYTYVNEADLMEVIYPIRNDIYTQIGNLPGGNYSPHTLVKAVVDYLGENCEYTLTPRQPAANDDSSALKLFLTDIKEGYCVQFATAATMILRSMNIPTRYAEGYIAAAFHRNDDPNRSGNYISDVHDYNAHAWIEVYVEGIGWMQYETTPAYYVEMYAPYEDLTSSQSTSSGSSMTEETPIETTDEITDTDVATSTNDASITAFTAITVALVAIAAAVVCVLYKNKARKALDKRHGIIDTASRGVNLEDERIHETAKRLHDYIIEVYAAAGCVPYLSEQPTEFAKRVSIAMRDEDFNVIVGYIEKEEFGSGVTRAELKLMGDYLRDLWEKLYYGVNPFKRFWLRYVKRVM